MNGRDYSKSRTEEIQNMIVREFPSYPYGEVVTKVFHPPSAYEAEADDLNTFLKGKSWRDLYPDFVNANEDDYLLMNGAALVAFLGAWLWISSEGLDAPNRVRSSLIYHLATYKSELWGGTFKSLSEGQRKVIHVLLEYAAEFAHEKEKSLIERALRGIDTTLYQK